MANTTDLKQIISEYLSESCSGGDGYQKRKKQERKEALEFTKPVADLFNSSEFQQLLVVRPNLEIELFSYSRGSYNFNKKPDYEVVVNKDGLCKRINGEIQKEHSLPAKLETWLEVLPYSRVFEYSGEDLPYKPDIDQYMSQIEAKLKRCLK